MSENASSSDVLVAELLEVWKKKRTKMFDKEKEVMTYNHGKDINKKNQIASALAFWRFTQQKLVDNFGNTNWEVRRGFLCNFVNDENVLISTIAMIESLPTSVWRKILLKYNIDFSSPECYLRRLEENQLKKTKEVYKDLIDNKKIPNVFGFFYKLFNKITVEKLLNEDLNIYDRYQSKGAMSYDLCNLGIGFNAYPKGENDDTKITEVSPLRFLSTKNHADDFVVNQEDGIYWWLYQTARNYGLLNKKVQLKTHICPGFWYTFIVHFLFWIASPIATTFLAVEFFKNWSFGLAISIPLVVLSSIQFLWCLLALGKMFFCFVLPKVFSDYVSVVAIPIVESIENFNKSNRKTIKFIKDAVFSVCVYFVLGFVLWNLVAVLINWTGKLNTLIAISWFGLYLGYKICHNSKTGDWPELKEYPLWVKLSLVAILIYPVSVFFEMYTSTMLLYAVAVLNFIIEYWLIVWVVLVPWIAFLPIMFLRQEQIDKVFKYINERGLNFFVKFAIVVFASGLTSFFLASHNKIVAMLEQNFIFSLAIVFVYLLTSSVLCFILLYSFVYYSSSWLVENNEKIISVNRPLSWYHRNLRNLVLKAVTKNKWLRGLNMETRKVFVKKIIGDFLDGNGVDSSMDLGYVLPYVLAHINEKSFAEFNNVIAKELYRKYGNTEKKTLLFILIADGCTFDQAEEYIKKQIEKERRIREVWQKIKIIFLPFKIVGKIFVKIYECIITAKRLYDWFNEKCPYVFKPKYVGFK